MIDDKEIDIAARAQVLSKHINETAYFQLRSIEDFKAGAKWMQEEFLKNLWHHISEEPKKFRKILYTGGSIDTTDTTMLIINNSWNTKVNLLKIKKWCYIDDLFTKEGGDNEGV